MTPAGIVPPRLPHPHGSGNLQVQSVSVGTGPIWATYDPKDGDVYIPNSASNTVSILNGTRVIATIAVGSYPYSGTYDGKTGDMYILNQGSNSVSVLSGSSLVGTVAVGMQPNYAAYDPTNGYIYVPNQGSSSVTVISGTKVVATVGVGNTPWNATYDPTYGYVYVPNNGANTVSVINGTKVIATVNVGSSPWSSTYDPAHGWEYVPNSGSNNVSIINGTKLVGSVLVGSDPLYGGYDPATHDVYQANFVSDNVTILNGTKQVSTVKAGAAPIAADYDPFDGYMYIANSGNGSVTILNGSSLVKSLGGGSYSQNAVYDDSDALVYVPNTNSNNVSMYGEVFNVTFSEQGLPPGTSWSVAIAGGASNSSGTGLMGFRLTHGGYAYTVTSADTTYAAPGGSFEVSAAPAMVSVVFSRVTYPVNFTESGLPSGTPWAVTFGGVTSNSTTTSPTLISFRAPNGTVGYRLAVVPGYTTRSFVGSVAISGSPQSVNVVWNQTLYTVLFNETGLPSGTEWWINVTGGPSVGSVTGGLTFEKPNGSYSFSVATANKSFSAPRGAFSVAANQQNQTVVFSLLMYLLSFVEIGLAKGTSWAVLVGGRILHSSSGYDNITEPNGTYAYTIAPVAGWTLLTYTGVGTVHGKTTPPIDIVWTRVTYAVTFSETGLPAGTVWNVTFGNQSRSSAGEILFPAFPNGTFSYKIGAVAGYDATPLNGTLTVDGQPVPETIAFQTQTASTPTGNGSGSTFLGLPATEGYAVLGGIVVAIAAVAVGMLLWMRRRRPPAGPEPGEEEYPAGEGPAIEEPTDPPV